MARYVIKPFTPHTFTDKAVILARIEAAAAQGYAMCEQQLEPGVRGIAVPLKNHKAETLGAISLSVLSRSCCRARLCWTPACGWDPARTRAPQPAWGRVDVLALVAAVGVVVVGALWL